MSDQPQRKPVLPVILVLVLCIAAIGAVWLWRFGTASGTSSQVGNSPHRSAPTGTLLNVEPFDGMQIHMKASLELLAQFNVSEDVRGAIYVKPDTWDVDGKTYDIEVILGLDHNGYINMITIDFLYPQKLAQAEADQLDTAIRDWMYATFDRSIIEEANRADDWPGLLRAGGSNNISLVYEYIPEMWLQLHYVPSS